MSKKIELTRRQALAGLGTIGVASAGAGLGTSALFSDTESFEDNSITAGELDLIVDYTTSVDQDGVDTGSTTGSGTVQGGESGQYQIADAKPGDSGELVFEPKVVDNPAWVHVGSDGVVDYENGQTEPETEADPSGGGSLGSTETGEGAGELSEAIEVTVSYEQGSDSRELNNPDGYALADLFKDLESGFLLDGKPFAGDPTGPQPYPGSPDQNTQTGPTLVVEWELPLGVGNEVQSDAVAFDVAFAGVQARNNGDPTSPFLDSVVAPADLQSEVDSANPGDVIGVTPGTLNGTLTIGTEGVTVVSTLGATPTVAGAGGNTSAVSIAADGVTFDGFEVTNANGLLGVKVESGVDDVTVCNCEIRDVGPTGNLGVTGIVVGQGDHENVALVGNLIEDLEQTDDGSFATLNGILFDADNSNPGTLTGARVARNTIRDSTSTTAPLGIVVQHDVEGLTIEDNAVSNLTADNSFGPGSFTTFAQGVSIDSASTAAFDIVGNTFEDIESQDGFFAEDIKIEPGADVSGITVSGNNLLSAIGLNNANGSNPEVDAENNYWGASGGPLEIQNNVASGDVPTGGGPVDLDTVTESAVTENVDYAPFASSSQ